MLLLRQFSTNAKLLPLVAVYNVTYLLTVLPARRCLLCAHLLKVALLYARAKPISQIAAVWAPVQAPLLRQLFCCSCTVCCNLCCVHRLQLPPLGQLQKLLIGINNKGQAPSWHLSLVEVVDENTGAVTYFAANRCGQAMAGLTGLSYSAPLKP
jgi:hypothetical protein